MKKTFSKIISLVLICTLIFSVPISSKAAQDYYLGETYAGTLEGDRTFKITLSEKSHLSIVVDCKNKRGSYYHYLSATNESETVIYACDVVYSYNSVTNMETLTCQRILPPGTYYIKLTHHLYEDYYAFYCTAEKAISVSKAKVTSFKSTAKKKATVAWDTVSNVTGYEVQVAKNAKFTDGVQTKTTSGKSCTFSGLTPGQNYYVRVRGFANYGDGARVNGTWSTQKMTTVKSK